MSKLLMKTKVPVYMEPVQDTEEVHDEIGELKGLIALQDAMLQQQDRRIHDLTYRLSLCATVQKELAELKQELREFVNEYESGKDN